jgi:PAS domain S-box-containing protein
MVEDAADIIYALGLNGRFTFYNSRAPEILGCNAGELVGHHFSEILTPETVAVAQADFERGIKGNDVNGPFQVEAYSRFGGTVPLEVRARNLCEGGRIVGRQGIARDVSDVKALHAELAENAAKIKVLEDRIRIAREFYDAVGTTRELYDGIAEIIFRGDPTPETTDSLLKEMRGTISKQLAKSLGLCDIDLKTIRLVADGLSNREIGTCLHVSPETVKGYLRKIMGQLDVRSRAQLVAQAAKRGLL